MNYSDYCLLDLETTGKNKRTCQPVQIASVMIHGRKLEIKPGSEFQSLIKPIFDEEECKRLNLDPLTDESIAIHGKTRAMLEKAPSLKSVWSNFTEYVNQHNFGGSNWTAPIMAGYNSRGYDSHIIDRICCDTNVYGYGPVNKNGEQCLFNTIKHVDIMDIMFLFHEDNKDVKSLSVDNLIRGFMGYSKGQAHDAMGDVLACAEVLIRALRLIRKTSSKIKWKGCLAEC